MGALILDGVRLSTLKSDALSGIRSKTHCLKYVQVSTEYNKCNQTKASLLI